MGNFSNYWDLYTLFTKIKNKIKSVSDSIPTKLSDLTADATHRTVTDTEKSTWNGKSNFSGSYNDLTNKPTIPAAQVNSDWNATTGVAKINNKPTLATVATSGSYNDLSNKPTIPTKTSELTNNSNFVADSSYVHTDNNYTTAEKTKLSGIASGAEANVQSDWNQTTTTADDFIKNKPSSMPASDVSAWAKASTKPSYNFGEIGDGVAIIGNGEANRGIKWRTANTWHSGVYYNTNYDESVVFANQNTRASWMFAYTDIDSYTSWASLTPSMQIKNGKVTINKLIPSGEQASYNLDVNGTANATTIYENGTALSSKYAAKSDIPTVNNGTLTIQKNGTNVQTFTANQSTNATANITVPTTASDINAAPASDVPFKFGVDSSGNYGYIKAGADTVTPFKTVGTRSSNITANGTYTASSDISKDGYSSVTVAVPSSVQTKTVTAGTSNIDVTPDSGYVGLSKVTVSPTPTETKSVTPTTSAQTITPSSGKYLSSVSVSAISTQTKSVTPSTSAQTVTPDSGKYLTSVSVGAISTQTKSVTPSTSAQTVTPDSGKYLSSVTVYPQQHTETIKVSANGTTSMGDTHNYKIVDSSGAYSAGYSARAPVTLWTNPSPTSAFGNNSTTITDSRFGNYSYIIIYGRCRINITNKQILGGFKVSELGTDGVNTNIKSKGRLTNGYNFVLSNYAAISSSTGCVYLRFCYYNKSANQITFGNCVEFASETSELKDNNYLIPEYIIGIL